MILTPATPAEIAERTRALLIGHPDVIALYCPQPVVLDIAAQALSHLAPAVALTDRVRVHIGEDGTKIAVLVGLAGHRSAVEVCRELHDLIASDLNTEPVPQPLSISVTISSVN